MKRAVIVHGWGGDPSGDWFQWLKRELETKGFFVDIPKMPDTFHPTIESWLDKLSKTIGVPDRETFLVGHSIGCQTILRYVEQLPENAVIGGIVLVAAWLHLTDETWDEEYTSKLAEPWVNTPIDLTNIKNKVTSIVAIQSDNDPYVPPSDVPILKERLGAEIINEHNSGHISGEDGIKTLPSALKAILTMPKTGQF